MIKIKKIKNNAGGQAKASIQAEVEIIKELQEQTPEHTEAKLKIKESEIGPKNIRHNSEDIGRTQ